MSETFKSFSSYPVAILNTDGEILDLEKELAEWKKDLLEVTELAEWNIDYELLFDLGNYLKSGKTVSKSSELGRILDISLPDEVKAEHAVASRFERMVRARAINEVKGWHARMEAKKKTSSQYVSQGWSRTASDVKPVDIKAKMSLSVVDRQHSEIINDPLVSGAIELRTVIGLNKRIVVFPFDKARFPHAVKVTMPDVSLGDNGNLRFNFTAYETVGYPDVSDKYVVTVDVGISSYATVSVLNRSGELLYTTTLSRRVQSLLSKVKKANIQVASLRKKGKLEEAAFHRKANVSRKRELAIISAQEVADLAHQWDNAVVVFEDLSWVRNTMQNGRWSRGEFVKWTQHYLNQNGSLLFKVSAKDTSQLCHRCDERVSFRGWHTAVCQNKNCSLAGHEQDRDVNATRNIAKKFFAKSTLTRTISTRRKSKKYTSQKFVSRTPAKRESLKYPGRDRTKTGATPSRKRFIKKKKQEVKITQCSVGGQKTRYLSVATDGGAKHTTSMTERQHKTYSTDKSVPVSNGRICQ